MSARHNINDLTEFQNCIDDVLNRSSELLNAPCSSCTDRYCRNAEHISSIDEIGKTLSDICILAADLTLPKVGNKKTIPNWNCIIRPQKDAAYFWGYI